MYHPNKFVMPFFAVVLLVSLPACGSSGLTSLISTPTPTLEPTPTPEEIYMTEFAEISTQYKDASTFFIKLGGFTDDDLTFLLDDDWKTGMATVLEIFTSINEDVRALTPPEQFVSVHDYLLNTAENYEEFVNLFTVGVDGASKFVEDWYGGNFTELDSEVIEKSAEAIRLASEARDRGNNALRQATEAMERKIGD